ncbi:hypothetical protein TB1_024901 [Malus domestica]
MIMMSTLGWRAELICFGTFSPERQLPAISLEPFGVVPRQMPGLGVNQHEGAPEPLLSEDAMAWLDEFMSHIGSKKEDLPEPSTFHINMAYVLSAMFSAEPNQPATMKGDYVTTEPMMAHVYVEIARERELGKVESSEESKDGPLRIYTDNMVFSCPNMLLTNHLKPIYVAAHLEGVPFKRILIDG